MEISCGHPVETVWKLISSSEDRKRLMPEGDRSPDLSHLKVAAIYLLRVGGRLNRELAQNPHTPRIPQVIPRTKIDAPQASPADALTPSPTPRPTAPPSSRPPPTPTRAIRALL